jgi:mono/diheme cytochrome c family protein
MLKRTCYAFVIAIAALSVSAAASAQAPAADTYKAKCQMCHGADGLAATPAGKAMKTPPFTDPAVLKASDDALFTSTKNGKGKMPAYAGKLSDTEIKSLIAFVHTLQKK